MKKRVPFTPTQVGSITLHETSTHQADNFPECTRIHGAEFSLYNRTVQFSSGAVYNKRYTGAIRPHTSHAMLPFSQLSKTATVHTLLFTLSTALVGPGRCSVS
jgi:hypothetical protein